MGVAALVLGIVGVVMALLPTMGITQMLGVVLGLLALVLGIIGRRKAKEEGERTGVCTAGIALGIVGVVLSVLLFAACTYCKHKLAEEIKKPHVRQQLERGFQEGLRREMERQRRRRSAGGGSQKPAP